jgi:hypothetical protein
MASQRHPHTQAAPQPLAAAVAFANMVQHKTATISLTGGPASTPVTFAVKTAGGGTYTQTVTTDGTGAASISMVPEMVGNPTVTVTQLSNTTVASGTAFVSGH